VHHARGAESLQAENVGASLWITGISGTTVGTFGKPAFSAAAPRPEG
jgi:hypothetical protein